MTLGGLRSKVATTTIVFANQSKCHMFSLGFAKRSRRDPAPVRNIERGNDHRSNTEPQFHCVWELPRFYITRILSFPHSFQSSRLSQFTVYFNPSTSIYTPQFNSLACLFCIFSSWMWSRRVDHSVIRYLNIYSSHGPRVARLPFRGLGFPTWI